MNGADEPGWAVAGGGHSEVTNLPLCQLRGAAYHRSGGVDERHARLLAESSTDLPPIVVQRTSMRVVDGMHRVRVAQLRGHDEVAAVLVDLDDDQAFLQAVAANVTHGLPLSLTDRRASATRIVMMYPEWSDRRVAKVVGLSGKTVASLRQDCGDAARAEFRTGSDGRVRPTNAVDARQAAWELLERQPDSSLRQVAAASGLSATAVRAVRDRMQRDGAADSLARARRTGPRPSAHLMEPVDVGQILYGLIHDPSLRYTEVGRTMLRWLRQQPTLDGGPGVVMQLPAHCLLRLAQVARQYAGSWNDLAEVAERRAQVEAL